MKIECVKKDEEKSVAQKFHELSFVLFETIHTKHQTFLKLIWLQPNCQKKLTLVFFFLAINKLYNMLKWSISCLGAGYTWQESRIHLKISLQYGSLD